jgi:hypothetical protein
MKEMTQEEYNEWKKTQKEFLVEFDWIKKLDDGKVQMAIRNGDRDFRVGDFFGGAIVLKFEAYQQELEVCGRGMTGLVTLSKMPYLNVMETWWGS